MAPTARIEAPGVPTLHLTMAEGFAVEVFDLGDAVDREVVQDAPDMDGTIDTTALTGARDLIIAGTVFATETYALWQQKARLRRFRPPRVRSNVFFREHADADEQVLRGCRAPQVPRRIVDRTDDQFRIVLRVPSGAIESAVTVPTVIFPGYVVPPGGWEFDWEFDLEFPAGSPPGGGTVVNEGTADAYPMLRIDGPCSTDDNGTIVVESLTADRRLVFRDLTILEGDYLEIDVRAKTIRLNSLPDQSRHDRLDMSVSQWWLLAPGVNDLRFLPEVFAPPSHLTVTHSHTDI